MSHLFDYFRHHRIGLPECVYCEGKSVSTLDGLLSELAGKGKHPVLLTRLTEKKISKLRPALVKKLDYHALSQTAFLNGIFPERAGACVAIVAAGLSDLAVMHEASRTLEYLGIVRRIFSDVGVAGLWRLEKNMESINACDVVIVVAGMEAAIASVLGGLTPRPVIAVPTSVGYGAAEGGRTALNGMLVSCSPGITVVNIDNGFGAACAAFRILQLISARKK